MKSRMRMRSGRLVTLLGVVMFAAPWLVAQTAPGATPKTAIPKAAAATPHVVAHHAAAHHASAHHARAVAQDTSTPVQAPVVPPEPEKPNWPVNSPAAKAAITWDSRGLFIDASNSSLQQILGDVATAIGASIDGLGNDQRIFGTYGPGEPREVLTKLLQGTGYNVLLIGEQSPGVPRQILLSTLSASSSQPAARPISSQPSDENAESDVEEQPEATQPQRPGFGVPGRGPPQMMLERQQQIMRAQQQQQDNGAPAN